MARSGKSPHDDDGWELHKEFVDHNRRAFRLMEISSKFHEVPDSIFVAELERRGWVCTKKPVE